MKRTSTYVDAWNYKKQYEIIRAIPCKYQCTFISFYFAGLCPSPIWLIGRISREI